MLIFLRATTPKLRRILTFASVFTSIFCLTFKRDLGKGGDKVIKWIRVHFIELVLKFRKSFLKINEKSSKIILLGIFCATSHYFFNSFCILLNSIRRIRLYSYWYWCGNLRLNKKNYLITRNCYPPLLLSLTKKKLVLLLKKIKL